MDKFTIQSFEKNDFAKEDTSRRFTAPINPESFSKKFKIGLDKRKGHGNDGTNPQYIATDPEELRLDFILDGTGTMQGYLDAYKKMKVHDQLAAFLNCAYNMDGDIHRPRFLKIKWGRDVDFQCLLSDVDINFTLFDDTGDPLRVRISATFLEYKTAQERLQEDRVQSPDLSHYQKVNQGDRLDLMTYGNYNDSSYFLKIAQINKLASPRNVPVGMTLYFPPFDKGTTN
ncbi:MAG TPA: hypothetical protein VHE54_01220 [Puia sp.]|nr:hypothetical protein [Puia sp.]